VKTLHIPFSISGHRLGLAACIALAACTGPEAEAPPPRPVRAVQIPAAADLIGQQRYAARIEARHEAVLAFQMTGRVSARRAEVGDAVAAGAVLARLDDNDFRLRERDLAARLAAARAERTHAANVLRRANELRPKGFISQADYDLATYRDQATAAQVEALAAQRALAQREQGYTTLIARTPGVITARTVETGQVVSAGQPVFSLARTDEIEVVFDLPEQRLADLPETVEVTLWIQPDRPLTARVREVAPRATEGSRTYCVRATLAATDAVKPRLGMSASVAFSASSPLQALPASAVLKRANGQPAVWVIDADRAVRLRPVTLGPVQGDQATVADGLAAGDWVVTAGVHDLRDGQLVSLP
jgi:multidrug efflux system membrane fusion protein